MSQRAARILIVEDTASLAQTYAALLEDAGHIVDVVASGADAHDRIARALKPYDAVLLDLQLPDCDGLEWLGASGDLAQNSSVIVATANGSINRAISAMRLGAYDFLVKPVAPERLLTTTRNAVERHLLAQEVKVVSALAGREHFQGFIGKSNVMQAVYRAIENVADSKATIFITGESGTGKEVAAEAIHRAGKRAPRNFIAINCGAIPENLLESEVFGHVKGAFTGAVEHRLGAAREADGGTLFLDEICEMELKLQVKLLRFLQTGMIQRVGSSRPEPVDVRIVCATNRNPMVEVAAGRFREDLFYRLSVIPLELPPLRDRGQDIALIAQTFLARFAKEEGKVFDALNGATIAALQARTWPGNVRELQNVIRRAVVMNPGPVLAAEHVALAPEASVRPKDAGARLPDTDGVDIEGAATPSRTLAEIERMAIEQAIIVADGSIPGAAKMLAVSPSTIYRLRERWKIDDKQPSD